MAVARGDRLYVPAPDGPSAVNVIVTGPESSGTRFVSRWLEAHPDVAARHWSMPSGEAWARHWPSDHDYEAIVPNAMIVVIRNYEATIASQLARNMVSGRAEAEANITQALLRSFAWAVSHGIPTYPLVYDAIVEHPELMAALFTWVGVEPVDCPEDVVDANDKWRNPPPPEEEAEVELAIPQYALDALADEEEG